MGYRLTTPILSCVVAMALVAGDARAEIEPGPTFVVTQQIASPRYLQDEGVAAGTDGTLLAFWGNYLGSGADADNAVLTQRFTADGTPLGPVNRVDIAGYARDVVVASDTRGGFIASWGIETTIAPNLWTIDGVKARLLDASGAGIGDVREISPTGRQDNVASLPSGAVFFWATGGFFTQLYDATLHPRGAPVQMNGSGLGGATPDGGFIVLSQFWVYVYRADGQMRAAFRPNSTDYSSIGTFQLTGVAVSPTGTLAAFGIGIDGKHGGEIHVRYFTLDGVPLTDEFLVNADEFLVNPIAPAMVATQTHSGPVGQFDQDGNLFIVWAEYFYDYYSNTVSVTPPQARAYDPNGLPLAPVTLLSTEPAAWSSVAMTRLSDGRFATLWTANDSTFTEQVVLANVSTLCPIGVSRCTDTTNPNATNTPRPTRLPTQTPTATPLARHDSVILSANPIKITMSAAQNTVGKVVGVAVRNADINESPQLRFHAIQVVASDGDCPPGTIVGRPTFNPRILGSADWAFVNGGATAVAQVAVKVSRDAFPDLDNKIPQRCTIRLRAQTVLDGNIDPTSDNNGMTVELNVFGSSPAIVSTSAALQSAAAAPPFYIVSAKPFRLNIPRGVSTVTKTIGLAVSRAGTATLISSAEPVVVTANDGDCPIGTVGVIDFDRHIAGAQNVVTVPPGKSAGGALPVTVTSAGFTAGNAKSPGRCTASITTSAASGGVDTTNHTTGLIIEVTDYNDF